MTDDLRQGTRDALVDLGGDTSTAGDASIEHASLEVRVGNSHETVSLRMREGRLRSACTCGDGNCPHLRAALKFVAAAEETAIAVPPVRSLRPWAARPSLHPDPRRVQHSQATSAPHEGSLVEVLEDIVTGAARAGVTGQSSLSVQDPLERLLTLVRGSEPLGISRFVGRLRPALEASDVDTAATLLHAASQLAVDLRESVQTDEARQRQLVWLGAKAGDERTTLRISDRSLLEIAREWVHGHERFGIERRYLADIGTGEVYCEERLRRGLAASVGSCPRLVGVGLAEAERFGEPRRLRLMQYTVAVDVTLDTWQQLGSWAERNFVTLAQGYRAAHQRFAGACEPFAIVAPAALARDAQPALLDDAGHVLPLYAEEDDGTLRRFADITAQAAPSWVAGRLVDRSGRLMLRPLSIGILSTSRMRYERL